MVALRNKDACGFRRMIVVVAAGKIDPATMRISFPLGLGLPPPCKTSAHRSGRQRKLHAQMLDVFHQRLNSGAAVSIVPCNDVVHRIGFRFSSFWAHVLILRFKSSNRP